jgi:hypothetical protein
MNQYFTLEKVDRLLVNKLLLIKIAIFIMFISCKSQNSNKILEEQDVIQLKECSLSVPLRKEILVTLKLFKNKIHQNPKVVRVTFVRAEGKVKMRFATKINLYTSKEEKEFYNESFFGATIVDGVVILIIRNNNLDLVNQFATIQNNVKAYNIIYGGDMTICERSYFVDNNNFVLDREECPSKLIQE